MKDKKFVFFKVTFVSLVILVSQMTPKLSIAGFNYICVQPGDRVYITLPALKWSRKKMKGIKSEYRGINLFKRLPVNPNLFAFKVTPTLEIAVDTRSFENEALFDGVRFLYAQGRLYTWISITANPNQNGVIHEITPWVFLNGIAFSKGRSMTLDVRSSLRSCN